MLVPQGWLEHLPPTSSGIVMHEMLSICMSTCTHARSLNSHYTQTYTPPINQTFYLDIIKNIHTNLYSVLVVLHFHPVSFTGFWTAFRRRSERPVTFRPAECELTCFTGGVTLIVPVKLTKSNGAELRWHELRSQHRCHSSCSDGTL